MNSESDHPEIPETQSSEGKPETLDKLFNAFGDFWYEVKIYTARKKIGSRRTDLIIFVSIAIAVCILILFLNNVLIALDQVKPSWDNYIKPSWDFTVSALSLLGIGLGIVGLVGTLITIRSAEEARQNNKDSGGVLTDIQGASTQLGTDVKILGRTLVDASSRIEGIKKLSEQLRETLGLTKLIENNLSGFSQLFSKSLCLLHDAQNDINNENLKVDIWYINFFYNFGFPHLKNESISKSYYTEKVKELYPNKSSYKDDVKNFPVILSYLMKRARNFYSLTLPESELRNFWSTLREEGGDENYPEDVEANHCSKELEFYYESKHLGANDQCTIYQTPNIPITLIISKSYDKEDSLVVQRCLFCFTGVGSVGFLDKLEAYFYEEKEDIGKSKLIDMFTRFAEILITEADHINRITPIGEKIKNLFVVSGDFNTRKPNTIEGLFELFVASFLFLENIEPDDEIWFINYLHTLGRPHIDNPEKREEQDYKQMAQDREKIYSKFVEKINADPTRPVRMPILSANAVEEFKMKLHQKMLDAVEPFHSLVFSAKDLNNIFLSTLEIQGLPREYYTGLDKKKILEFEKSFYSDEIKNKLNNGLNIYHSSNIPLLLLLAKPNKKEGKWRCLFCSTGINSLGIQDDLKGYYTEDEYQGEMYEKLANSLIKSNSKLVVQQKSNNGSPEQEEKSEKKSWQEVIQEFDIAIQKLNEEEK